MQYQKKTNFATMTSDCSLCCSKKTTLTTTACIFPSPGYAAVSGSPTAVMDLPFPLRPTMNGIAGADRSPPRAIATECGRSWPLLRHFCIPGRPCRRDLADGGRPSPAMPTASPLKTCLWNSASERLILDWSMPCPRSSSLRHRSVLSVRLVSLCSNRKRRLTHILRKLYPGWKQVM